jgi:biopolymer transport protein ExbD
MQESALAEQKQQRAEAGRLEEAEQARKQELRDQRRPSEGESDNLDGLDTAAAGQIISVALDAKGNVEAAGQVTSLVQLRDLLQTASVVPEASLSVVLYVDPKCPFEHVVRVQGLCDELGVGVARIRSRDITGLANSPPKEQTADSR